MRMIFLLFAAILLALSLSGCAATQLGSGMSEADRDPTFRCPSGDCQGANSAGNMGGNHQF